MKNMRERKAWLVGFVVVLTTLATSTVFAEGISLKGIGQVPIIALIIGVIIVLMQLIPAGILFFSFIGTICTLIFKGKKSVDEVIAEQREAIPISSSAD